MRRALIALLALLALFAPFALLVPAPVSAQEPARIDTLSRMGPQAPAEARAARARVAPVIDGSDADEVWRTASPITGFRQFEPAEGAAASERTEAWVAYDDRNLYVLVRAYDAHPDSIRSMLGRRDEDTQADKIRVIIDAYRDRRTGVEMDVNPAGVRRDASIYDDVEEDESWDGVWDVGTRIDSIGWVAEFRIPLSQLRFTPGPSLTFGFGIWREIARRRELVSWPAYSPSRRALASQLGALGGMERVPAPQRLEVTPYVVLQSESELRGGRWGQREGASAGGDLKYGLTRALTLDATVNPDFAQVEADPSEINLTAFETRFEERRPFFLEGVGLFRCGGPCEGIFYTRRIGRAPQLRRDDRDPAGSTILGAAKLTGRLPRGLSVGLVAALTDREVGVDEGTVEPRTNHLVGRVYQELNAGRSGLGAMVTALNRDLDAISAPVLRRDAYTWLTQGFHRFAQERYEVMGYVGINRVSGSPGSIALTQLGSIHYYQRSDGDRRFDSTRTTLGGAVKAVQLRKLGGNVTFLTNLRHADPGVELNDLGFVPSVNEMSVRNNVTARTRRPGRGYRRLEGQVETFHGWTTGGLPTTGRVTSRAELELPSGWQVEADATLENARETYCTTCARGGPSVRRSPRARASLEVQADERRAVAPFVDVGLERSDVGRSSTASAEAGLRARLAGRLTTQVGLESEWKRDDRQWVGNFGDVLGDTTHYTFARLRQRTVSMSARATYAVTAQLSLQLYAQPFVSAGSFSDWRELGDPRAARYADRYRPFGDGARPGGFNAKEFNSNVVARWEYRPGSTLFVVWQQGREDEERNPGSFALQRDARDLFRAHPSNTVLVKASWWLNP